MRRRSAERRASVGGRADFPRSYAGTRYYSGQTGRFISVDPVLLTSRHLRNPESWNRYTYANNNPFRYVDPDGRAFFAVLALPALKAAAGTAAGKTALLGTQLVAVAVWVEAVRPWFTAEDAVDEVAKAAENKRDASPADDAVPTPRTHPERFRAVRSRPGKVDVETGEVFERDPSRHGGEHYEVYRNLRDYEKWNRYKSVSPDGRHIRDY